MFVQPLIGCPVFQAPQMLYVWPHLDVVKVALAHHRRNPDSSTIPRHFVSWVLAVQILSQFVDIFRFGVSTHKAHTGDLVAIFAYELVEHHGGQWVAHVRP